MSELDDRRPTFSLPDIIKPLVAARNAVRQHYDQPSLTFTFDGNLVGDLGEAIAIEMFGLELGGRCREGVDGMIGTATVQVKATGTGRGPSFRKVETEADYLLFFNLDLEQGTGIVEFNGPEAAVRPLLPTTWAGQHPISMSRIRKANLAIPAAARLPMLLRPGV